MAPEQLYDVYLYNDHYPKPVPEMKLSKITIPARIVKNAIEVLKRRHLAKERIPKDEFDFSSSSIDHQIMRQSSIVNTDSYLQSNVFIDRLNGFAAELKMAPAAIPNSNQSVELFGKCQCGREYLQSQSSDA